MLRCVGVIRAVQHSSKSCILLKKEFVFANNIRNFSHLNVTASSSVLHKVSYKPGNSRNGSSPSFNSTAVRFASSSMTPSYSPSYESNLEVIPEPPPVPELLSELPQAMASVASGIEPSITTLGLGGWTPAGIVQTLMEYLHIGVDLPWWTCIMIGTICVRTLIFPLVIMAQRNAAKMNNNLPQMQHLQLKLTEARQSGNAIEAARFSQELVNFMREKELNPFKNVLVPLAQAPLFISFFIGLRQMANAPVESMRDGGLFWFTDLTVPDQFFLLPIITSLTMLATIELGTDSARLSAANLQTMKYVLRAMPFGILLFTFNFPGAILVYWTFSNFISLLQVGFLKIPRVREYFKIDKLVTHKPESMPIKNKGFKEGLKESWTNMKISRELEDRRRADDIVFQQAAKGAIQKTYKFDPTKKRPASTVAEKRR